MSYENKGKMWENGVPHGEDKHSTCTHQAEHFHQNNLSVHVWQMIDKHLVMVKIKGANKLQSSASKMIGSRSWYLCTVAPNFGTLTGSQISLVEDKTKDPTSAKHLANDRTSANIW